MKTKIIVTLFAAGLAFMQANEAKAQVEVITSGMTVPRVIADVLGDAPTWPAIDGNKLEQLMRHAEIRYTEPLSRARWVVAQVVLTKMLRTPQDFPADSPLRRQLADWYARARMMSAPRTDDEGRPVESTYRNDDCRRALLDLHLERAQASCGFADVGVVIGTMQPL